MSTSRAKTGLGICILMATVSLCAELSHAATGEGISNVFTIDNRTGSGIQITSLEATYQGVFPKDVEVINTFTATVDWEGSRPSKVIFQLNGKSKEVTTSSTTAQTTFNMGQDLIYSRSGQVNELTVYAMSANGQISQLSRMNLWGLKLPEWAISLETKDGPIDFKIDQMGRLTFYGEVELLKQKTGGTVSIPDGIPGIGGEYGIEINPLNFEWELAAQPRFGDGAGLTGSFDLSGKWGATAKCGKDREGFVSASLGGAGEFYPKFRLKEVSAELSGSFAFDLPEVYLLCAWNGCCVDPCPYGSLSLTPEIAGTVKMEEGTPALVAGMKFSETELLLSMLVKGMVGSDGKKLYKVEGGIGGKPTIVLQFPKNPDSYCGNEYIKEISFVIILETTTTVAWWDKEWDTTFDIWECPETGKMKVKVMESTPRNKTPKIMSRDYLNAAGGYCVFPGATETNDLIKAMSVGGLPQPILNVGPLSVPSVAATNDNGLLLFVYDDSSKPTGKHQEIYFARWNGDQWALHAPITDNLKPDTNPVAAIDSSGTEIAVWMQAPEITGTEEGPRDVLSGFDIVWSKYDAAGDSWQAPVNLTNNSYVDAQPYFDRSSNSLRAVWIASATNAIPVWDDEDIDPQVNLMASDWTGSSFDTPYVIADNLATASPPAVCRTETHEIMAYLKDYDNNSATNQDVEVIVRMRPLSGAWSSDYRLTNDTIAESTVEVAVNEAGMPIVIWTKRMVPQTLPDGSESTMDQVWFSEYVDGVWNEPKMAFEYPGISEPTLFRNEAGKIVLFWNALSDEFWDIYYSVYDAEMVQWGLPQQITHDQGAETMLSLSESGGNILASYVKRRIDMSDPYSPPVIGASDIYLMEHVPAKDLSVNNEDISFDPEPVPDANSLISADIHLSGDFTVTDVKVQIFDGDPEIDGQQIGEQIISQMLPGQSSTVSVLWDVPNDGQAHPIYVVVDPDNTIEETQEIENNKASVTPFSINLISKPPVVIGYPSENKVIVGFTVKNAGSMDSGSFQCEVRQGGGDGPVLYTTTINNISAGQTISSQFEWDVSGDESGIYDLIVISDSGNVIAESSENDNSATGQIPVLPDIQVEQWSTDIDGLNGYVTVRNVGPKLSDPNIVQVSLSGQVLGESELPALNSGESVDITVGLSQLVVNGKVEFVANPSATVADEVSTLNNKAYKIMVVSADFDESGVYDFGDVVVLTQNWLKNRPDIDIAPPGGDGVINCIDFSALAELWLVPVINPFDEDFETGDFSKYEWQHSGNANWGIVSDVKYEGTYAAKSGTITHSQTSTIEITLDTTFENISFYGKVSSESNYDYLRFYIDGTEQDKWSGTVDWTQHTYTITPGEHTFKWSYTKDGSVSNGSDCAWIDDITLY